MNREKHINWCKGRALKYTQVGDFKQAWNSMVSDLCKHSDTVNHPDIQKGTAMLREGLLNSKEEMEDFIDGIN